MKPVLLLSLLGLFLAACTSKAPDSAQQVSANAAVEVDVNYFQERLSPHGDWVEVREHGWVWFPEGVAANWRPYTVGHWEYCDDECGWLWVSDEDWGWATYHYGRWAHVDSYGWVWVPGYEWASAWVVWRHGGGVVGWAPLSPAIVFEADVGLRVSRGYDVAIYEPAWVFVSEADFVAPNIVAVVHEPERTRAALRETTIIGSVSVENRVIVNKAFSIGTAERFSGKTVRRVKLRESETLGAARISSDAGTRRVFRPKVKRGTVSAPPRRDEARRNALLKTQQEKQEAERREGKTRSRDNDREIKRREPERREPHRQEPEKKPSDPKKPDDEQKPNGQPEKKPEREVEKSPEKDIEEKPEKQSGKKPEQSPEKVPEKKSDKKPERKLEKQSGKPDREKSPPGNDQEKTR